MSVVDWEDLFHCFQFNDHVVIDKDVDPVADLDFHAVINDRLGALTLDVVAALGEFMSEACLVGAFQKARTEL